MQYSEKLNGYWEEGYHYYIEIRDGVMTVLDYHRRHILTAELSYDAAALDRGEPTELSLSDNVLSRDGSGEPMTMIRSLKYVDGRLELLYYYTILGETLYVLNKVPRGPFAHLELLDAQLLDALQGRWYEWSPGGRCDSYLLFEGNKLSYMLSKNCCTFSENIHVIREGGEHGRIYVTPEALCERSFGMFSELEYRGNMLTTYMHICDASVPMTVFARKAALKTLAVPPEALEPMRSTMLRREPDPRPLRPATPED